MKREACNVKHMKYKLQPHSPRFTLHASRKMFHTPRFTFHERGFSLLELIIYIGIVTAISGVFIAIIVNLNLSSSKSKAETEVQQNLRLAMGDIAQTVRNGTRITSPAGGASAATSTMTVFGINPVTIVAGRFHALALLSDSSVKAWGYNANGRLGNNSTSDSNIPIAVPGISGATAISAGEHSLALLSNGTVKAWGWNYRGELGDGTTTDRWTPITVPGLSNVTAVSAGTEHSLALLSNGTIKAWGYNLYGQLGDGTNATSTTPVTVSGITTAVAIIAKGNSSYALLADGTMKAWGRNAYGQLGDDTTTDRNTPVAVCTATGNCGTPLSGISTIGAGGAHGFAILNTGKLKAWGFNASGQVGDGTTTDRYAPVTVCDTGATAGNCDTSPLLNVTSVIGGGSHSIALLSSGAVKGWGYNFNGQVGDNSTTTRNTPVNVSGISTAVGVSAGGGFSLAVVSDGSSQGWGYNFYGQVGDGSNSDRWTPVTSITGINTRYFLSGTTLKKQVGSAPAESITNDEVNITYLNFATLQNTATSNSTVSATSLQYGMTVGYNSSQAQFTYAQSATSTAALGN